jgi:hypothetical protein
VPEAVRNLADVRVGQLEPRVRVMVRLLAALGRPANFELLQLLSRYPADIILWADELEGWVAQASADTSGSRRASRPALRSPRGPAYATAGVPCDTRIARRTRTCVSLRPNGRRREASRNTRTLLGCGTGRTARSRSTGRTDRRRRAPRRDRGGAYPSFRRLDSPGTGDLGQGPRRRVESRHRDGAVHQPKTCRCTSPRCCASLASADAEI